MALIDLGQVQNPPMRSWERFPTDDELPTSSTFLCDVQTGAGVKGFAYFRRRVEVEGLTAATRAEKHYADGSVRLLVVLPLGELPPESSDRIEVMFVPWERRGQTIFDVSFHLFKVEPSPQQASVSLQFQT